MVLLAQLVVVSFPGDGGKRGIPISLVGRRQRQYRSGSRAAELSLLLRGRSRRRSSPRAAMGPSQPRRPGTLQFGPGPSPRALKRFPRPGRYHRGLHMHRGLILPLTDRHRVFVIRESSVYTTSLVRAGSVKRRCALRPPGGSAADSGVRGSGFLVCPDLLAFRQVGMSRCVHSSYYVARPDQPQRSESLDSLSDHP